MLGHMNSAFVFARLYLGFDSDWARDTAPSGLVKDAWDTRLMIFVLSHLAAGARALMLSQGVARLYPGIIATGDGRRGRDTKLVVARNRWFESISLQQTVWSLAGIRLPHVEKSGVSRGCVRTGQAA